MDGSKPIRIEFLEPHQMRYSTCGDYFEHDGEIVFQIAKQNTSQKNLLIFLHEFIEFALCTDRNITEKEIMDFDLWWNERLKDGDTTLADEPGNEKAAPYFLEHRIAENYERQLASHLNIDWQDYSDNLIL